jgi:urease accessory protein
MTWLAHAQLLDSALPIGAFSHSFGLETLIQEGQISDTDSLREYCETMLHGAWATCDVLLVKAVYCWPDERDELWRLDTVMHLARPASETRDGGRKMGKRFCELGRALHPQLNWQTLSQATQNGHCIGTFPLVYGWACYELGVPLERAATGFLFTCVNSCLNNATRAMRLGQTQAQSLLAQLLPQIEQAWHEVEGRDPWEFETATPLSEIAMMRHENLYSRLFMS